MKRCKFDSSKPCWHSSCDWIDSMGNVDVCPLVPNPDGRFVRRRVGFELHGVFDKHVLRRS